MSTFLAIDFGEQRTGVAVGNTEARMVTPLATLNRTSDGKLIDALQLLVNEHEAARVVVGLPCLLDGSEGDAAKRIRSFARKLQGATELALHLVSETLTSREAAERIRASGGSRQRKQPAPPHLQLDAVSAQIIGEQFLAESSLNQPEQLRSAIADSTQ